MTAPGSDERPSSSAAQPAEPHAARAILCVQPKEAFYAPLRFALASYGLLFVRNAFEAIRALNARAFDAYVLDYRLPDLSGVSLCRQIRQSDPNVPICFFTSSDGRDAKSRAARAGAQAYVSAPYDANALAVKLPALFQRVDVTSLHARLEEENVAHEEIRRRSSAAVRQSEQLRARASKLLERAVRVGAQSAFLKAGGNPGGLRARVAADVCRGALEAAVGRQRT